MFLGIVNLSSEIPANGGDNLGAIAIPFLRFSTNRDKIHI